MDINLFMEARKVVEYFQNRYYAPPLTWCAKKKSKLKKVKHFSGVYTRETYKMKK